ncbi:MAG: asparagine synthase (glutamine-hydrolyzing) [Bacteroidota bacterium]
MCGINGFIDHNNCVSEADFKNSSALMGAKNTNGIGIYFEKKASYTLGFANERLSTIDLSERASQPLTSTCGNYTITLNGTIYNYLELRENLIKYGIIFSTLSDTEVVLECYKKWGNKSFEMLDGSFSFALLDRKLKILLVGRDDIGAKPLYFYRIKGFYAFASEIKTLLTYPFVKKEVNKKAMATFFRYGYFKGNETIYQNINQFTKGNLITIDIHSGNSYDYPLVKLNLKPVILSTESEEEVVNKIEEILTESILKRNIANVPVGILLGSGYDSSTVAAILQTNQSKRIKTFTVGYKNEKLDEAPKARKIAEHLKTNHQELYLDKEKAFSIVKNLTEIFDEPIGDSSAVPVAFIAEQLHRDVKVLLGSEGGDEMFGGYRTYAKVFKINEVMQKPIPKFFKKFIVGFYNIAQPKMKEVIEADTLINKYLAINACFTKNEIKALLDFDFDDNDQTKVNTVKELLIHDLHNYLPDNIIAKNDRCFRYFGIENRDALLKTELIDYLSTLDASLFLKNGEQKYLLKKITHKYISDSLINNPKKGFVIPLSKWLKTSLKPLVKYYLSPSKLNEHQLFNINEVKKITNSFYLNSTSHNAQKVWLILQFQMWYEKWMIAKI